MMSELQEPDVASLVCIFRVDHFVINAAERSRAGR